MKWTNDQLQAINHSGENILVSAGAGSGKTAILSERVIRILKDGAHINELLILTFTKAASEEMKERIRDNIISAKLDKELDLIDSSYITTFDSFALSMVKKYHYLVNVDKDISIMDSSILAIEKERIIRSVLEKYYSNNDEDILFLIKTFIFLFVKMCKINRYFYTCTEYIPILITKHYLYLVLYKNVFFVDIFIALLFMRFFIKY